MFLNALIKSVNMPCDLLGLVYTSNCECDVVLSYLKYCQWQWYFGLETAERHMIRICDVP